ncbi:MAG: 50S ribosomal protein L25 [Elusimicrobia bacterium]|nr:50S ribosomal protein L25 [Elusimicrobiota bacterium]
MEQLSLNALTRENAGVKGKLSAIRNQGQIPAVVYGSEKNSQSLTVNEKEFIAIMKKGHNAIIKLKYDKAEDSVIVKEIQRHVVSGKIIHVDFYRISMKEKIEVKVPLKFVGEAYGVKTQGGIIEHDMRELTVKCLPADIPHEITVDVSALKIGDSVRVKDLKQDKIEIKEDAERIVASVITAKEEVVEKAAAVAEGAQEPEVIAKGKKEEEGAAEAGKEAAKPAEKKPEPKK